MKFKNLLTNEVIEAKDYVQIFAYSHNSNWEKIENIKEVDSRKELSVQEIKTILEDNNIEYKSNANKSELLKLLNSIQEEV